MNTLEERVATLERELSALKEQVSQSTTAKNWRLSVGIFAEDPVFEEMVREGREYREQQLENPAT
jgi:hypothetical protein